MGCLGAVLAIEVVGAEVLEGRERSAARPTVTRESDASIRPTAAGVDVTAGVSRQEASLSNDGAAALDEGDTIRRHVVAPSREEAAFSDLRAPFSRRRATSSGQRSTPADDEASSPEQSEAFGDDGDTATRQEDDIMSTPTKTVHSRPRVSSPTRRTRVRR